MEPISKSQINRLGDRLRRGEATDADIRLLDRYRREALPALESVIGLLSTEFGLKVTGRRSKSIRSIVEKLKRESTQLSRMQDIVGCRIVVSDVRCQDSMVLSINGAFAVSKVFDRRKRSSHGYRAVHVVTIVEGTSVEIQVRTLLQHRWAELSERLADAFGNEVKYGGGPAAVRDVLSGFAKVVEIVEHQELTVQHFEKVMREEGSDETEIREILMDHESNTAIRKDKLMQEMSLLIQAFNRVQE